MGNNATQPLPSVVNDRALFTRAATYGNVRDKFYHSPLNRIATYLSPGAALAATILLENFPPSPTAPRKPASPTHAARVVATSSPRSPAGHTNGSPPLSPNESLHSVSASLHRVAPNWYQGRLLGVYEWELARYQAALALHSLPAQPTAELADAIARYLYLTHHGVG